MSKYPRSFDNYIKKEDDCPNCGLRTQIAIKKVTQETWFRGDDEVEYIPLCPVCNNWKTYCIQCGKLCLTPKGLDMHFEAKHSQK